MKCLTPECGNENIRSRGLCSTCYYRLFKRVKAGTTKWSELIEQGLATRAMNRGGHNKPKTSAEFSNALKYYLQHRDDPGHGCYDPERNKPRFIKFHEYLGETNDS